MEMLCDRKGDRTATGRSLQDEQGRVDYLVEVCDPCQQSTYTIDGVLVSDFVTPGYYGDPPGSAGLYSFTGRISEPRQLLDGGYLTWSTQPPTQEIWQAIAPKMLTAPPGVAALGRVDVGRLTPARFSREWIDLHTPRTPAGSRADPDSQLAAGQPLGDAQIAFTDADLEASRNGASLRALISDVLTKAQTPIDFNEAATKTLLQGLATPGGQTTFVADPVKALAPIAPGTSLPVPPPPTQLPPQERYTQALNAFNKSRFGTDLYELDLPGLVTWMCQLGSF
jgi:hypothetical protein